MTRILIADDHDVVRRGLRSLLDAQPGWSVCAEAANGREAVEKTARTNPDIAVLDISMPELNGLEAARQIAKTVPRTQVLILTMHESEEVVQQVIATGARGYVFKSDAAPTLVAAISAVLAKGTFFFSPKLPQPDTSPAKDGAAGLDRLTMREREVLQLLAEGRSNKEVAARLGISPRTAETHRTNIMHKLKLHSIGELVRFAIRNRVITS